MSKKEIYPKTEFEDRSSLKGTLFCATILGIIMLVSWFYVFNIFVQR
ncbi:cytochrome c oxidase subunit 2A [Calidifontibacillus erzurumensis]|uniref:Cytochrome c oxidase subunit 2A n=1 Tax=Calidifontibacillus erzurumensis TaxID=2741433 RepID=A0A8J8KAU6_9BACI|nr:cytochrome c oxidase subunit 2A [Calidifontibacillus erzurumensis]NSL50977.1 cytochrome c oxidase subunit 2A [Calidifontibacillus erzurumensis]